MNTRTLSEIGKHAGWHPSTHTWSHKELAQNPYAKDLEKAEQEIEMVNSVVHIAAAGGKVAPFFRFPDLQTPPQLLSYFANRNIAIFSTHIDSRDFTMHKAEQVINSVMSQLEKRGKGIVLLHDFHRNTAAANAGTAPSAEGGRLHHRTLRAEGELSTITQYDEMFNHGEKLSSNNTRPENNVVRAIGE